MKPAQAVLACILLSIVVAHPQVAFAQDAAASAKPDAPLDDLIHRLVVQLGDPDFATREQATQRLRAMGKAAMPALKEATGDIDPEIRSRASVLLRRLERRPLPGGPLDRGVRGGVVHRITFGEKAITVNEEDRQFEIVTEDDGGIRITVTANEKGQQVTETYAADDAAELRELEPEAYRVYERWGKFPAGGGDFRIQAGQLIIDQRMAQMRVRDELDVLREQLEEQMRRSRVAAAQMREVLTQLDKLQAVRQGDVAVAPEQPDRQIKEYFRLSDVLRTKLAELKLDAGEALPPPPNQRLGVQLRMNADPFTGDVNGVIVLMVVTDSRAAKIGLREEDHVLKINDKPIRSTQDIRDVLAEAKAGLVVELVRGGKTIELTEKVDEKK
jgi:hypothetical protein